MLTRTHNGTPTKRHGAMVEIRPSYALGLESFAAGQPQNLDWSVAGP